MEGPGVPSPPPAMPRQPRARQRTSPQQVVVSSLSLLSPPPSTALSGPDFRRAGGEMANENDTRGEEKRGPILGKWLSGDAPVVWGQSWLREWWRRVRPVRVHDLPIAVDLTV